MRNLKEKHAETIARMNRMGLEDGTYIQEGRAFKNIFKPSGYQVSFYTQETSQGLMSDEAYQDAYDRLKANSSDRQEVYGMFDGEGEISFHITNRNKAIRLGREFKQYSIWDWERMDEIIIKS